MAYDSQRHTSRLSMSRAHTTSHVDASQSSASCYSAALCLHGSLAAGCAALALTNACEEMSRCQRPRPSRCAHGGGQSAPCSLSALSCSGAFAGYLAPSALAAGGNSIAAAPTVAYGQQEFGNTLTDNNVHVDCHGWSYWLLPVTAGDHLTIDFEGQGAQSEALYPVGTNDFNVTDTSPVQEATLGENGHQQALYTVKQTGVMPLVFYVSVERGCGEANGPYDFTVSAEHALVLSLSAARVNRHRHETTFGIKCGHSRRRSGEQHWTADGRPTFDSWAMGDSIDRCPSGLAQLHLDSLRARELATCPRASVW